MATKKKAAKNVAPKDAVRMVKRRDITVCLDAVTAALKGFAAAEAGQNVDTPTLVRDLENAQVILERADGRRKVIKEPHLT